MRAVGKKYKDKLPAVNGRVEIKTSLHHEIRQWARRQTS